MRISQKGLKNLLKQLGKEELKEKVVKVHFRMYVTTGLITSIKILFNYFFLLLILMSCHHKWQKKCSLIHWFEVK